MNSQTSITGSRNDQERLLRVSTTMYVGNLSFFTTEEQLYELFGKCGDVKRIIMGLDKFKRTPCGFCFVEYYTREDSENAQRYINGTRYCFLYLFFTKFYVKCIFSFVLAFSTFIKQKKSLFFIVQGAP